VVALTFAAVDEESTLVERLRAGDEQAFAELVRLYQPRLQRLARVDRR
jgi:DNA-directed RNA polymerase specialized sigma24 family protein